ncbi:AarF/ABC1/UbiB kinase family protein [Nocardia otitidiscaviarum]|uniref:ABC1 kinase family protein n=1 Tax=Nocardia otitidiscaviarum TaxID=1823 RepID=UPI0005B99690|nr:AarF/ABC1/UbiB kinase family protein [Nocardia otitidiscaviarum]MBF6138160.1 AarF/ABC1/UbiB kinase family protein [Nocardia otitidiscaviarum]MBF6489027.1 AarF/ABC1/UbiB kinase family protein [Nocardia otitidiscaviarum]
MSEPIPTSRLVRGAKLGKLVADQAFRGAGVTLATMRGTEEQRLARTERALADAAEDIVTVLGSMKGLAMKAGQLLSMFDPLVALDAAAVPSHQRERFRRRLAALYDQAPQLPFARMRAVIERDHGCPIGEIFSDFDEHPIGAASIGQVYRARLRDGRAVAVKVQYPGVDVAIRADLKNLALVMRMMRTVAPALAEHAMFRELTTHFAEETDYRAEAEHHRMVGEMYRGHPFIRIPEVVTELCTGRVLVTELVEGLGFDEICALPAADRDRVGEVLFRFYVGTMAREHRFTGDPHPGNILLAPDGAVVFLDFGLFKHMNDAAVEFELSCVRAAVEYRAADLRELLVDYGVLEPDSAATAEQCLRLLHEVSGWLFTDAEIRVGADAVSRALLALVDPRRGYFENWRREYAPAEHAFARRVEYGTLALLGKLRASGNWHRIGREWCYGDRPRTELGVLEHDWLTDRTR